MNPIFAAFVAFTLSFGLPILLGASRKSYGQEWYRSLRKPSHSVSDITFNVVFIIIYISETVALFHILTIPLSSQMFLFAIWFLATAILSGLWSRLFFQYKRCMHALSALGLEIILIWALVYALNIDGNPAWIFLLPRAVWGLYAVTVNLQLYRLNVDFWKSQK
jgi:tryptophan-rich sensory protein